MTRSWYVYMGYGNPTIFSNYRKLTVKHACLCGNQICAIYAAGEETHPEAPLSINLQQYIKKALATGAIQPELPPNTKKYVYLRYQ